jgi:hypothetical protein
MLSHINARCTNLRGRLRELMAWYRDARACRGSTQELSSSRADHLDAVYLRAAQAYMLISMPTGTSTILGVFQVIPSSQEVWRELHAELKL